MKARKKMSKITGRIEGVGLSGLLCPLDDKPKSFAHCLECTKDICDIPSLRARTAGVFKTYENEYHVTDAIGPPLITKFKRENPYYVKPDSLIAMFIGTAVHHKIEIENYEEEFEAWALTVDGAPWRTRHEVGGTYDFGDFTLVGTMDYVDRDRKLIQDYKCLGSWKTRSLLNKHKGDDDEYFHQLNVYRAAFYPEAEILRLHIFVKDFSANSQRMYKLTQQEYRVGVPIYDAEKELDAVRANIEESRKEKPRSCTKEETWNGVRCKRFCPNYTCFLYEGPEYNVNEVE